MREPRKGSWSLTASGTRFFPLDPRPSDIHLWDIAHALSNLCRFGGHCRTFYSVAQHSVHVSRLVPPHLALQGLMHDAPEAYLGDVIRPLKYELPNYLEIERQLWRVIAYRFGLPEELSTEVKHADNVALMTERRDLIIESPWQWEIPECPDDTTIVPVELIKARQMFLERFSFLQAAVRKEVEG